MYDFFMRSSRQGACGVTPHGRTLTSESSVMWPAHICSSHSYFSQSFAPVVTFLEGFSHRLFLCGVVAWREWAD